MPSAKTAANPSVFHLGGVACLLPNERPLPTSAKEGPGALHVAAHQPIDHPVRLTGAETDPD